MGQFELIGSFGLAHCTLFEFFFLFDEGLQFEVFQNFVAIAHGWVDLFILVSAAELVVHWTV